MAERPVHWAEGLFLRPQHFQLAERHLREQIRLAEEWNVGHAYGIHHIKINTEALKNYRIDISEIDARLPDGTHVRFPGDTILAPLPFSSDVVGDHGVRVYLGVPALQWGRANAVDSANTGNRENADDLQTRYVVEDQQVEDENRSGDPQELRVRLQHARILLGHDQTAGYSAIPLMQLKLGDTVDAAPEIDSDYFPPLLSCSAWPQLNIEVLKNVYDYLGKRSRYEVQRFRDHKIAYNSGRATEFGEVLRLQSLNAAMGGMTNIAFAQGLHPLTAYMELCRIVGTFAIFDPNQPGFPDLEIEPYDHDDSAPRFYRLKKLIENLVETREVPYVMREFKWDAKQMRVRMDDEWFSKQWRFFIGIHSSLGAREIRTLFSGADGLDLKVGPSEEVDMIFQNADEGIRLIPEDHPPHSLNSSHWTYWNVDRNSNPWKKVTKSHELGIRFKDRDRDHVLEGKVDGDTRVRLKERKSGDVIELKLALFAMPAE